MTAPVIDPVEELELASETDDVWHLFPCHVDCGTPPEGSLMETLCGTLAPFERNETLCGACQEMRDIPPEQLLASGIIRHCWKCGKRMGE